MVYDSIQLDPKSHVPLYQQLYLSIKNAVENGHLQKGDKLPSIRKLSADLNLSCTTVDAAYQQLCVEGYLTARPKRGYFVLARVHGGAAEKIPARPAAVMPDSPTIRYNFGSDSVDSAGIDIKIWRRHIRDVLNRQEVIASYGDPQGEPELREALSAYTYGARGVIAPPERIVIGAGTQPLLSALCGLIRPECGLAAFAEPGFPQAEQVFSDCGIPVSHLPADESGVRMEALYASGAHAFFVSPAGQTPTGSGTPMTRRVELLDWAGETGGILIEDDYNGELRYTARPIPAIQGMDGGGNVVYLGSFSKLLLPSVRIGYMVLPARLLEQYRSRMSRYNQTASKIEQLALSRYIREGQLERQLRRLRKLYAQKSGLLLRALKRAFGGAAKAALQETMLTVTLSLRTGETAESLCRLAAENGVRVQPAKNGSGSILLGFAGIPVQEIEPAVQCLKAAWQGNF
ncbi:MAG: PLP-dependent aminotransferase family protein [Clostridiales bacterium]|nr:PLP-dependent aminotransferase family protein [Clostridiales bacterium]